MFHVSVAIILAYVVVELSSIQKCSKLSENIFVLKHSSQFFLAAKLQNQVRFIAKYCIKDYNSTVSKIELPFLLDSSEVKYILNAKIIKKVIYNGSNKD